MNELIDHNGIGKYLELLRNQLSVLKLRMKMSKFWGAAQPSYLYLEKIQIVAL